MLPRWGPMGFPRHRTSRSPLESGNPARQSGNGLVRHRQRRLKGCRSIPDRQLVGAFHLALDAATQGSLRVWAELLPNAELAGAEEGMSRRHGSLRHSQCVLQVSRVGAGFVGVGVFVCVAITANSTEGAEGRAGPTKLRLDGVLDSDVTAAAGGAEPLDCE